MVDIVLLNTESSGNIGAVCRVMANFGCTKLILVNPQCTLDAEFKKYARHSKEKVRITTRKRMPKYDVCVGTTAAVSSDYNIRRTPVFPEQIAKKLGKRKAAIVFGRESSGMTNEELDACNIVVTINTDIAYPSLNLSHAVAIILYELHKHTASKKIADNIEPAAPAELQQIDIYITKLIKQSKFQSTHKASIQKKMWQNIMQRALLTKREAHGIMGLLRKLQTTEKSTKKK